MKALMQMALGLNWLLKSFLKNLGKKKTLKQITSILKHTHHQLFLHWRFKHMGTMVVAVDKTGENVVPKVVFMLKELAHRGADAHGVATPNSVRIQGVLCLEASFRRILMVMLMREGSRS